MTRRQRAAPAPPRVVTRWRTVDDPSPAWLALWRRVLPAILADTESETRPATRRREVTR